MKIMFLNRLRSVQFLSGLFVLVSMVPNAHAVGRMRRAEGERQDVRDFHDSRTRLTIARQPRLTPNGVKMILFEALKSALSSGDLVKARSMLNQLVEMHADLNTIDDGCSLLHWILKNMRGGPYDRKDRAVRLLLQCGGHVNINAKNAEGKTPVMVAITDTLANAPYASPVVTALVGHGADVLIPDAAGITPLRRAQMNMENYEKGDDFCMKHLGSSCREAACVRAAQELIAVLARAEEQQNARLAAEVSGLGEALRGMAIGTDAAASGLGEGLGGMAIDLRFC